MQFGQLQWLWLIWLVPLLIGFYAFAWRSKAQALAQFASLPMMARLTRGVSMARQRAKAALLLTGVLCASLALAHPQFGFAWQEIKREGVDIVIALDVSDSMLVEDVQSDGRLSRLERAKREITDLLRLLKGDRIGLVAFAGAAFIECPLTLDYNAAEIFLQAIDTDLIPIKGTAIGEALGTSIKAFKGGNEKSRAIILITDGEDNEGQGLAVAEQAKAAGIAIYTIGIGRDEGAPIPNGEGGFRRDHQGNIILSKLDETSLQQIASITGGKYVHSTTGDMDLEQIYTQGIRATLQAQDLGSQRRQHWHERFQWFLLITLIALIVEPLIRERGLAPVAGALPILAMAIIPMTLALSTIGPTTAYANTTVDPYKAYASGDYDQALQGFLQQYVRYPKKEGLLLNIGAAQYKLGRYDEAHTSFTQALQSTDASIRAQAQYNLGNVAYRQDQLEEAIKHYQETLKMAPNDKDAKANLAYVQQAQQRRQQQQQEQDKQKQQNKQDDQQQQQQDQQSQAQQEQQGQSNPQKKQPEPSQGQKKEEPQQQAQQPKQDSKATPSPGQEKNDSGGEQKKQSAGLSEAEATRYLNALEERKPTHQKPLPPGARRVQPSKDW